MLSQSLLTGQKYIDLDFLPNEKARFAGLSRRYPELPTTTTAMEKLSQKGEELVDKLAALPVDQMLEDLRQALQQPAGAARLARSQGRDRGRSAVDGRAPSGDRGRPDDARGVAPAEPEPRRRGEGDRRRGPGDGAAAAPDARSGRALARRVRRPRQRDRRHAAAGEPRRSRICPARSPRSDSSRSTCRRIRKPWWRGSRASRRRRDEVPTARRDADAGGSRTARAGALAGCVSFKRTPGARFFVLRSLVEPKAAEAAASPVEGLRRSAARAHPRRARPPAARHLDGPERAAARRVPALGGAARRGDDAHARREPRGPAAAATASCARRGRLLPRHAAASPRSCASSACSRTARCGSRRASRCSRRRRSACSRGVPSRPAGSPRREVPQPASTP